VDFVDWSTSKAVNLPHLKPTLKSISLRLPEMVIEELKILANKRDVTYQSLLKLFLCERLAQELKSIS
jgi:predicted DNA binding CopG/RHH family protein